jgi:hypothetical protein
VYLRSAKSWTLIALGMVIMACIVLGVLTLLAMHSDLARVKVPGSNLTLVLYQDDKSLYRYDVLAGKKKVARDVMLGARGALAGSPQISVLGDQVIITFRTTENLAPFVEFDLAACRIVSHSNAASPPPPIGSCQRK